MAIIAADSRYKKWEEGVLENIFRREKIVSAEENRVC
jgi:hypothetical protein